MRHEDFGQLGQDRPGPKSLRHQPWCPREARVKHGDWERERPEEAGGASIGGSGQRRLQLMALAGVTASS